MREKVKRTGVIKQTSHRDMVYGTGNIVSSIIAVHGDRCLLDLLWRSLRKVYKC